MLECGFAPEQNCHMSREEPPPPIVFTVNVLFVVRTQGHMFGENDKLIASHTYVSSGHQLLWCCDYKEDMDTQATHCFSFYC